MFGPILGPLKVELICLIWLYSKQRKILNQNVFLKYLVKDVQNTIDLKTLGKWCHLILTLFWMVIKQLVTVYKYKIASLS